MAFAASSDLLTMTISNRVSLVLVGGFLRARRVVRHAACRYRHACRRRRSRSWSSTFVFFARGWIGGGDAKLAAATALWLGFDQLLNYLLYRLAVRRRSDAADHALPADAAARAARQPGMGEAPAPHGRSGVPYGIALAIAALWSIPTRRWMKSLGM